MLIGSPILTAGGTIGTWTGIDLANITGPTTIRGINSAMASGFFIFHVGVAPSFFAGELRMGDGVPVRFGADPGNGVELSRPSAGVLRMIGDGGTNNEGLEWDFDTPTVNAVDVQSSTGAGIGFNLPAIVFGTTAADPTANWQALFSPGAKTVTLGGDFARRLFSASGAATLDAAMSNVFTDVVNEPFAVIGSGSAVNVGNMLIQTAPSIGTNRYGLLITSNPSGGTLNYAFRQSNASARSRFDGRLDINRPIALGGGAAATLGTIGGAGPTAAAQATWVEIDVGGTPHWFAAWV